jgi:hypothetical protein
LYTYDNEDNDHKEKGDSPKDQWDGCEWQRWYLGGIVGWQKIRC